MSTNLYTFSEETLSKLNKFRFASARTNDMQALIYQIDQTTYEFKAQTTEPVTSVEDLIDDLPENSPRYIVLSYPLELKDGRKASPLVMGYWLPPTCTQSARMLYAAAVELFRSKCGVSKLIEFGEEEDFEELEEKVL